MNTPTVLYYQRYSSNSQNKDDESFHRQTKVMDTYRGLHGLPKPVRVYSDEGESGFHGSNLDKGLGELLQHLREGTYTAPVYVLVELLDRFTRTDLRTASQLLNELQGLATVISCQDSLVINQGSSDITASIRTLVALDLAHKESKNKSERSLRNHERCREEGRFQNSISKRYLVTSPCKTYKTVIESERPYLERAFNLRQSGYGIRRITEALNTNLPEGHKPYSLTFIANLFKLDKDGDRVSDKDVVKYGLVPADTFKICLSKKEHVQSGRPSDIPNLFKGLLTCALCGSAMTYRKAYGRKQSYLVCNSKWMKKSCSLPMVGYEYVEKALLGFLSLHSAHVFNSPEEDLQELSRQVLELEQRQEILETDFINTQVDCRGQSERIRKQLLDPIRAEQATVSDALSQSRKAYQDALAASHEVIRIDAPTTPEERTAFNLLLSRHLGRMSLDARGEKYRIKFENNSQFTIYGERYGDRWELDDRAHSTDNGLEPPLEFGPDFE